LVRAGRPCYDRPMRAFVCEVDGHGLRRLVPEDLLPGSELVRYARARSLRPSATAAWALLADGDAEDLRADVHAGRHQEACSLLLNRAVELLSLGAVLPVPWPSD
jgi:hypothetical protein